MPESRRSCWTLSAPAAWTSASLGLFHCILGVKTLSSSSGCPSCDTLRSAQMGTRAQTTEIWHPRDDGHDFKADSMWRLNGESDKPERRGSELLYSKIRIQVRTRVVQTFRRWKKERKCFWILVTENLSRLLFKTVENRWYEINLEVCFVPPLCWRLIKIILQHILVASLWRTAVESWWPLDVIGSGNPIWRWICVRIEFDQMFKSLAIMSLAQS